MIELLRYEEFHRLQQLVDGMTLYLKKKKKIRRHLGSWMLSGYQVRSFASFPGLRAGDMMSMILDDLWMKWIKPLPAVGTPLRPKAGRSKII